MSWSEALARFHATTDAALEAGRRAAAEAREAGSASDRPRSQHAEPGRPTSPDLHAAAVEFRRAAGLPVPEPAEPSPEPAAVPPEEDFSQERIMRKL
jgi:hypothetical protein